MLCYFYCSSSLFVMPELIYYFFLLFTFYLLWPDGRRQSKFMLFSTSFSPSFHQQETSPHSDYSKLFSSELWVEFHHHLVSFYLPGVIEPIARVVCKMFTVSISCIMPNKCKCGRDKKFSFHLMSIISEWMNTHTHRIDFTTFAKCYACVYL